MPWTRDDVCAFLKLSPSSLARVEQLTEPVPVVPLPGRGQSTIDRYDEDEVRAWWTRRVAEARSGQRPRRPVGMPADGTRRRRGSPAFRLPFVVGDGMPQASTHPGRIP